ncbi:hypothetical protein [Pedobacter gandavensis]|uniref:hypothetical protein n=1 Tax=Pedobacter gandavensis TaxID=2679963 RepID=UPI002931DD1B|nr:hypothetical protein [Pedobacter gandavensis]
MKKYYILLLVCFLFSLKLSAAALNSFSIQSQYLVGSQLQVSLITSTEFKVDYSIVRFLRNYGYEKIDWIVTVVYQKSGENEIQLTTPVTLTETILTQPLNTRTATATIPPGKVGGIIYLKFQALTYDLNGKLINNLRGTEYSSTSYTTFIPSPVIPPTSFSGANAHLFSVHQQGTVRRIDYLTGGFQNLGSNVWANTQGVAHLNGSIFIVQAGNLHKVNPLNGDWVLIGETGIWNGTDVAASSSNGFIYIIQNSRLHKVDPISGDFSILGNPEWGGTEAMVAYNGYLYVVQNSTLHKVDQNTGEYSILGDPDWAGTEAIASSGDGFIYIVQNGYLHKVNTNDGSFVILGGQDWLNTYKMGMAFYDNSLYILQNARLHKVNKNDGSLVVLGNPSYNVNSFLTAY